MANTLNNISKMTMDTIRLMKKEMMTKKMMRKISTIKWITKMTKKRINSNI